LEEDEVDGACRTHGTENCIDLVVKPEGKKPLVKRMRRRENILKLVLKKEKVNLWIGFM
jgi:hypothetical protein